MLATNLRNGSENAPFLFYRVSTVTASCKKNFKKVKIFLPNLLTNVFYFSIICNVKRLRKPTYKIN